MKIYRELSNEPGVSVEPTWHPSEMQCLEANVNFPSIEEAGHAAAVEDIAPWLVQPRLAMVMS